MPPIITIFLLISGAPSSVPPTTSIDWYDLLTVRDRVCYYHFSGSGYEVCELQTRTLSKWPRAWSAIRRKIKIIGPAAWKWRRACHNHFQLIYADCQHSDYRTTQGDHFRWNRRGSEANRCKLFGPDHLVFLAKPGRVDLTNRLLEWNFHF